MKELVNTPGNTFYKKKLEILYALLLTTKKLEDNIGVVERVLGVKKIVAEN